MAKKDVERDSECFLASNPNTEARNRCADFSSLFLPHECRAFATERNKWNEMDLEERQVAQSRIEKQCEKLKRRRALEQEGSDLPLTCEPVWP